MATSAPRWAGTRVGAPERRTRTSAVIVAATLAVGFFAMDAAAALVSAPMLAQELQPLNSPALETAPPALNDPPSLSRTDWLGLLVLLLAPATLAVLWFADVLRPGSFARAGVRQVGAHPWWIWLSVGVLIFMSAQLAGTLVHAAMAVPSWIDPPLRAVVALNGSMSLAGCAAGIVLLRLLRVGAGASAGVVFGAKDLWIGLACFVLAYPIILGASKAAVWITTRWAGSPPEQLAHETLKRLAENPDDPWAWGMRLVAVVLVPIFEELMYRVGLQSAVLRATGSPWIAILAASAAFTAAHAAVMPAHAMAVIAVLSISIGIAYERTKRVGVPIVMHALFNAVNVIVATWVM